MKLRWEVRQSNFMGGYDTVFMFPWKWMANILSWTLSKRGCDGEGCTAGCTFVAREEAE